MLIHFSEKNKWMDERLPALNKYPLDVAGAGDSMLAISSLAMRSGANIVEASYLASIAAGIQVSKIGNQPITIKEILSNI